MSHLPLESQSQNFTLDRGDLSTLFNMKGLLVPDVKLLTEHYTGNQWGGSLPGLRGQKCKEDMVLEVSLETLQDLPYFCSNKALEQLVREHCKQQRKWARMYSKGEMFCNQ